MKIIDKRKNKIFEPFFHLKNGEGFQWNGSVYLKTSADYAFNILENEEKEIENIWIEVIPVNLTVIIEKNEE